MAKCSETRPIKHGMEQMASKRLNTGVIRNGDDWPGIFIRGDETWRMHLELKMAVRLLRGEEVLPGKMDQIRETVAKILEEQAAFLDSGYISSRDEQPDGVQMVEYK